MVGDLLYQLDIRLLDLLRSLAPGEWNAQTLAPQWKVRDVAAHLLDGNLRTLSMLRDGYFPPPSAPIDSYAQLVKHLDQLNADWITAARRLSPQVIIDLLAATGREYNDYLTALDPAAPAVFPVAWAGEDQSANWFHLAREYTEKWHHQQQIREATGRPGDLLTYPLYHPYLDTSVRALPYHYREVAAPSGTTIAFLFQGEEEKSWWLLKVQEGWALHTGKVADPTCVVRIPDDCAWRIFTKGITRSAALAQATITGPRHLGEPAFSLLAIMG